MKKKIDRRPWGRLTGMLTACVVTVTGVVCGLEPNVILMRAAIAATVLAIAAAILATVVDTFATASDES